MTIYKRIKNGECSFTLTEEFDSAEKAAHVPNEGTNAEVKIENVKVDFTIVKKEKDGTSKVTSAKVQGSPREETQKVSGDKATS